MIFQNIDFHNVAQVEPIGDGWRLWRVPEEARQQANDRLRDTTAAYSTGIELRFLMRSDCVTIAEGQMAYLYFGSFQGGWQQSSFIIRNEETAITITLPGNMAQLQQLTEQAKLPFSPEVVRLVLPYGNIIFMGLEGEVIQCLPLWERSVASNQRNRDTISIEVCHPDDSGRFTEATYRSLVRLTAWLCRTGELSPEQVIRHYDVTGKECPRYFVHNEAAWRQLRNDVGTAIQSPG